MTLSPTGRTCHEGRGRGLLLFYSPDNFEQNRDVVQEVVQVEEVLYGDNTPAATAYVVAESSPEAVKMFVAQFGKCKQITVYNTEKRPLLVQG